MVIAGRPWNDLATTVYLRTFMDDSIRPAGWEPFDAARYVTIYESMSSELNDELRPTIMNTTFYAEYESYGL